MGGYSQFDLAGIVEGTFSSYYTLRSVTDEVLKAAARKKGRFSVTSKPHKAKMPGAEDDAGGSDEGEGPSEEPPPVAPTVEDVPGGGLQEAPASARQDPAASEAAQASEADSGNEDLLNTEDLAVGEDGLVHPKNIVLQSKEAAIIVIGCENFIANPRVGGLPQETQQAMVYGYYSAVQFFANAVDYLSLGGGFSNIRARMILPRHIDPELNEKPGAVFVLKLVGTVGGAFLAVLLGVALVFLRKASRRKEVVL